MIEQLTMIEAEDTPEYQAFVDKFKPKKTTDDCYTPPAVYEAIKDWACKEYGIDTASIVRPFYPGGDYERYDYPEGAVVLDNPPFSIVSKIIAFYSERNIPFFLFEPGLTALSSASLGKVCHIITDCSITYANGAKVLTAFVTNLEPGVAIRTAPELYRAVKEAEESTKQSAELPRYKYPDHVIHAAGMSGWSKAGVEFCVKWDECEFTRVLDSQRAAKKSIYGAGLLLSTKAAERKAQAQAQAQKAICWPLSEREKAVIAMLDKRAQ